METTFITIHDLSLEARILYSSDSIVDILGHTPDEVVNRSCWDFFHPDELPYAKAFHNRGVRLDKAAVLAYCQIRNREGRWVGCECCFTIVYDVMVVCTSIYRRGLSSHKRAVEAPIVRRLFSSSPKDPRYHMLAHLSAKFKQGEKQQTHEPRAALFLNRFTRTLTIMYATNGVSEILGISGEEMKGRSFYYCIQENCLEDAVRCLETAKGNDSIAYLRFWYRDPRLDDHADSRDNTETEGSDEDMEGTITSSEDDDEGGVPISDLMDEGQSDEAAFDTRSSASRSLYSGNGTNGNHLVSGNYSSSSASSGDSSNASGSHAAIFGADPAARSSSSSLPLSPEPAGGRRREPIELEAVVSCTSDGLVVCLRRARPAVPPPAFPATQPVYANGLFAAPWAAQPIMPPIQPQQHNPFAVQYNAPRIGQVSLDHDRGYVPPGAPVPQDLMNSIRDVAVFAWALTGINGSLERYSRGKPTGEAQPPTGMSVWSPNHQDSRIDHHAVAGGSNGTNPYSRSHMSNGTSQAVNSRTPYGQFNGFWNGNNNGKHMPDGVGKHHGNWFS